MNHFCICPHRPLFSGSSSISPYSMTERLERGFSFHPLTSAIAAVPPPPPSSSLQWKHRTTCQFSTAINIHPEYPRLFLVCIKQTDKRQECFEVLLRLTALHEVCAQKMSPDFFSLLHNLQHKCSLDQVKSITHFILAFSNSNNKKETRKSN